MAQSRDPDRRFRHGVPRSASRRSDEPLARRAARVPRGAAVRRAARRDCCATSSCRRIFAINVVVVDDAGAELASGRDLAALRAQLGEAAQLSFAAADPAFERKGLRQWDFGDLPPTLTFTRRGARITGYPGARRRRRLGVARAARHRGRRRSSRRDAASFASSTSRCKRRARSSTRRAADRVRRCGAEAQGRDPHRSTAGGRAGRGAQCARSSPTIRCRDRGGVRRAGQAGADAAAGRDGRARSGWSARSPTATRR